MSSSLNVAFFHAVARATASAAYHKAHTITYQGPARILRECATVQEARRYVFGYESAKVERRGNAARIVEEMPSYHPTAVEVLEWFTAQYPTTAMFAALADARATTTRGR